MSQQINLCNPLLRKQKTYFSALVMVQALGMLLVGILLFYAYVSTQIHTLDTQVAQIDQLEAQARQQLVTLAAHTHAPSPILLDQLTHLQQSMRDQQLVLQYLHSGDLGNQRGFSAWFLALSRQTVNGLWLTGFSITGMGDEIQLHGRSVHADAIARLIRQLGREPVFAGVHFAALSIRPPDDVDLDGNPKVASLSATSAPANTVKGTVPALPYVEFTLSKTGIDPEGNPKVASSPAIPGSDIVVNGAASAAAHAGLTPSKIGTGVE